MEDQTMPIAVIGMACRGPGDADNIQNLWKMCSEARSAWCTFPETRFNAKAFHHPDAGRQGTINLEGGYFMKGDLSLFDAPFFGMTSTEANCLDPQQRLLLECCYEAMENGGIPLNEMMGSNTSVYIGSFSQDWADMGKRDSDSTPLYGATGGGATLLSNRLSYIFDFKGPSITIDTACSGSLVALHLACQSLRTGESDQAIVGGSNVILNQDMMVSMTMMRFLSPDGRCYTFDHRANGYGRGEGAACVLLKPLAAALRDGDHIRAVIRNSGSNQDGKTMGITLPSKDAQEGLIRKVYQQAGLDFLETTYVEAHGTGTQAGDPIEASAIASVFSPGRDVPIRVGSIKTNVGHLEAASGVTALIKVVLMLEHQQILPNLNFEKANPNIPLEAWKIRVPTSLEQWDQRSGILRASLNSFGYGGTNAHVILEEAESYLSTRYPSQNGTNGIKKGIDEEINGAVNTNGTMPSSTTPEVNGFSHWAPSPQRRVFILSSFSKAASKNQVERFLTYLDEQDQCGNVDDRWLGNLAFTLNNRRSRFTWRLVVSASSVSELKSSLALRELDFAQASATIPRLGFVFTGQGAQWYAMGRELFDRYPVYRQSIIEADHHLKTLGADWSLVDELQKTAENSLVKLARFSQPMCTAIQIALVQLMASWKIFPVSVTGHSSGEIAGAYTSGALSLESALLVAYHRGVAASLVGSKSPELKGSMMAVGIGREALESYIASLTSGKVVIGCVNSPVSITVSGDEVAILELRDILELQKISTTVLRVDTAYHSHHMACVAEEYTAALSGLELRPSNAVKFYSSVTGKLVDWTELSASYWVRNMLSTVLFSDSLQSLCLDKRSVKSRKGRKSATAVDILVEIGPHSALSSPVRDILKSDITLSAASISYAPALIRNQDAVKTMQDLASRLLEKGYEVDCAALNATISEKTPKVLVDLPPYGWDRSNSFWFEPRISKAYRNRPHPRRDLLGVETPNSNPLEPCWRQFLRPSEMPWLRDHRVHSNIVFPAAGFACMAIEAAHQRATDKAAKIRGYTIREFTIGQALLISEQEGEAEVMLSMRPYNPSIRVVSDIWEEFCVFSVSGSTWTEHCRGLIRVMPPRDASEVDGKRRLEDEESVFLKSFEIDSNSVTNVDVGDLYKRLAQLGLDYGPTFATMTHAKTFAGKCVGQFTVSDTVAGMPAKFEYPFVVHPSTLDACLHNVFPAIESNAGEKMEQPVVPIYIDELFVSANIHSEPGWKFLCSTDVHKKDSTNTVANVRVRNEDGQDNAVMISIKRAICHDIPQQTAADTDQVVKDMAFNLHYQPDVDLLSPEFWAAYPLAPTPLGEQDYVKSLENLSLLFMKLALEKVNPSVVSDMHEHHRKLHSSITHSCELLSSNVIQYTGEEQQNFIDTIRNTSEEAKLICAVGGNLPDILRKEIDPLSVMLEGDLLNKYYETNSRLSRCTQNALPYLELLAYKNPQMKVLEIGAGTGSATLPILKLLGGGGHESQCSYPRFQNYDFTDISSGFFEKAKEKLDAWGTLVSYRKLDIEKDPTDQGFEKGSYDLIIASNVLHATKAMANTLVNVRKLLKPGGKLVMIEFIKSNLITDLLWGTLPGWWAGADDGRVGSPLLTEVQWNEVLKASGFSGLIAEIWDTKSSEHHQASLMISTASQERSHPQEITILADCTYKYVAELARLLAIELSSLNVLPVVEPLTTVRDGKTEGKTFIILSEVINPLLHQMSQDEYESVQRIILESKGILWVTRGGALNATSPNHALVSGLSRTTRVETAGSTFVHLDLDFNPLTEPEAVSRMMEIFKVAFNLENLDETLEVEYVERNASFLIPRILNNDELNKFIAKETQPAVPEDQPFYSPNGRCLSVHVGSPGLLDSIYFTEDAQILTGLEEGAVKIQVKASGINFRDVMMAMGQMNMGKLGIECSGIVVEVSPSVQHLKIGDRVATYQEFGTLGQFVECPGEIVQKIPDFMSFAVGASLPVVYCTAYHSLINVARIRSGETILIHAASGGLGQATITLAKTLGAVIYATVGTAEKKKLLMSRFQIPEENIFTSRDNTFAQSVMRATNGRGVDVVINSVAGDLLRETFNCIAPLGRFLELGKRDFYINSRLEMENFERNVTFASVDLISLGKDAFPIVADAWAKVMTMVREGQILAPDPITTFSIKDLSLALRTMQSGRHIGKLVIVPTPDDIVKVIPNRNNLQLFRNDASYLLVGGTGGLGRHTSEWMFQHGARNFVFASRSGITSKTASDLVEHLQNLGASVAVFACDISEESQLDALITGTNEKNMPPIRGVMQAAMVLKDSLFGRTSYEDWKHSLAAKVQGTWNLHNKLSQTDLDFFIILSSLAGIAANASQSAYSAAGTFQDAFANYRASLHLPVTTIDLGVITGIGYVSQNAELQEQLLKSGFQGVTADEYLALVKHAVLNPFKKVGQAQVINGLGIYNPNYSASSFSFAMFSHYRRRGESASVGIKIAGDDVASVRNALRQVVTIAEAAVIVCGAIISKMAVLLMVAPDEISAKRCMPDYGMDSLVAVEMRNWLFREMDATISILELLANTPLEELAEKIVQRSKLVSAVVTG